MTGFCCFTVLFDIIRQFRLKYHHFRLINRHLVDLNWSFNQFYNEIDWLYLEIAIIDSKIVIWIRIDLNQRSNSDRDFDSTTTIRFGTLNCISLLHKCQIIDNFSWGLFSKRRAGVKLAKLLNKLCTCMKNKL